MSRLLLFGVLLLAPALGLLTSLQAASIQELRWKQTMGDAGERLGDRAPTLASMCALDERIADARACRGERLIGQLRWLSGIALALALLLPAAMGAWALAARGFRLLLVLAGPLLWLWLAMLLVTVAAEVASAACAVLVWETVLLRRETPLLAPLAALLGGVALLAMLASSFGVRRTRPRFVLGVSVEPAEQPQLAVLVDELATRLGAWAPENLVLGLDPGVHASSVTLHLHPQERDLELPTLYLSLPLLRILTADELRVLVAHELAHWSGAEQRYSHRAHVVLAALERAARRRPGGWRELARWPAATLLGMHRDLLRGSLLHHEWLREWSADQTALQVGSQEVLARALVKLAAVDSEWRGQDADLLQAVAEDRHAHNLSRVFQRRLELLEPRDWPAELAAATAPHPSDRNLPLLERLELAGVSPRDLGAVSLAPPAEPAFALVVGGERMEESLSDAQQLLYRARLGQDEPPEAQAR